MFPLSVTPSNLNRILERLKAIQEATTLPGIGRVKFSYPYLPADVDSGMCPFCINEVSGGPTSFMAAQRYFITDKIKMVFAVQRYEASASLYNNNLFVAQARDAVFQQFALHIKLSPANASGTPDFDFIIDAYITAWDWVKKTIGSTEYNCLTFDLAVREGLNVTVNG